MLIDGSRVCTMLIEGSRGRDLYIQYNTIQIFICSGLLVCCSERIVYILIPITE